MRTLILMRGAPGCGKSTWIDEHGLRPYALSPDEIRLMIRTPQLNVNGETEITQTQDCTVWKILMQMLELRMQRGDLTLIDATNSKTADMKKYMNMAKQYRYRVFCIDMTGVPIETCIAQNNARTEHKRVPVEAIQKMYARFATQDVPSGITVVRPEDWQTCVNYAPVDLSDYEQIAVVGDIHGCYNELMSALLDTKTDNTYYIFVGDYIDRGPNSARVCKFIYANKSKKNFCFLEGNHERWLRAYGDGERAASPEFQGVTRQQLIDAGFTATQAREIGYRLRQCMYFTYNGKKFLVNHAGLSGLPSNGLVFVSTEQMVRGVGRYEDVAAVDASWAARYPGIVQIHGHRNVYNAPVQVHENVYNLEGGVERGGELRMLTIDCHGVHVHTYASSVAPWKETETSLPKPDTPVAEMVTEMRKSKFVVEKAFGNISSFNFTRDAFYAREWNEQTTKARGLFINTETNTIVARSYEKFFNIGERPETKLNALSRTMQFPATAYLKYNGYLGIVGYDAAQSDWFVASKTTPTGPYAENFRRILQNSTHDKEKVVKYLCDHNKSLVFECIDPVNDPHIIEYDGEQVILLDVIDNSATFHKLPYEELVRVGAMLGYPVKERSAVLNDMSELAGFADSVEDVDFTWNDEEVEGFVVEDANGYMVKVKSGYYKRWKKLRGVAEKVRKYGHIQRTGMLTDALDNVFYGWLREHYGDLDFPQDIISLRKLFIKEKMNEK